MKVKRGFTLIELLVVVAIIALLIAILLPSLNRAREQAKKSTCSSNLKQIFTAMYEYSGDNKGMFPMLSGTGEAAEVTAADNSDWDVDVIDQAEDKPYNSSGDSEPGIADVNAKTVSSNLWRLCVGDFAEPGIFLCPSSKKANLHVNLADTNTGGDAGGVGPAFFTDFPFSADGSKVEDECAAGQTIAYSFIQPWTKFTGSRGSWDAWSAEPFYDPARLVIGGDENNGADPTNGDSVPNKKQMKDNVNSTNHNGEGQILLYADGHAKFTRTAYAGMAGDNIYTSQGNSTDDPNETPGVLDVEPKYNADDFDTVLVPTTDSILDPGNNWDVGCEDDDF